MVVFHNDIINAIAQARNIRHLLASDILERWQQGEEATAEQTQSLIQLGDWIDFLTDSEQLIVEDCIDSTDVWNIIQKIGEQAIGLDCVGTNYNYNNPPPTPTPNVFNYVESVTGLNTNNADPQNPVVRISVDGVTITGDGTPASPLVASIPPSGVQSVTDDGNGVVSVDNTDPVNPIVKFNGVSVDPLTMSGDGTPSNPLSSIGGGSQTLAQTLNLGNTSGANDIEFDASQGLLFNNSSRLREGTIDAGLGGNKGIAQICAVGYELKWEAGRLYVMGSSGNTIRQSLYNFSTAPTATDDNTLGYGVGSLWTLDDGTTYECTDATTGAAVWINRGSCIISITEFDLANLETAGTLYTNALYMVTDSSPYKVLCKAETASQLSRTAQIVDAVYAGSVNYDVQSGGMYSVAISDLGNKPNQWFGVDPSLWTLGSGCKTNIFYSSSDGSLGDSCASNTFEQSASVNTLGNNCVNNTFKQGASTNTLGESCTDNTFEQGANTNTLGVACTQNTFKQYAGVNILGNGCTQNTFEQSSQGNELGINSNSNTFGALSSSNILGISNEQNTFEQYTVFNTLGDFCFRNTFKKGANGFIFGDNLQNVTIESDLTGADYTAGSYSFLYGKDYSSVIFKSGTLLYHRYYDIANDRIVITDMATPANVTYIGGGGGGSVTSVSATAGAGVSVSVSNPTTTPNITVTNTDTGSAQNIFKNVAVAGNSTIVADNNDDTLTLQAGTAISISTNATTDTIRIENTAPDQTVVLNAGTGIGVSGTYPNFTISNTSMGGGGSAVSYYLNGSVSQGIIGGNTYYQMSKIANTGAAANFTIGADGYIAQFLTDAGDPALLNIPAGNWDFQIYFSASSIGGSPRFYTELYKYDGTTFTLISSGSLAPQNISNGTFADVYSSTLTVPATSLTITDRLAIRVYVIHSGRTITMYTQDSRLAEVHTTFSTGITALNGLTPQVQSFAVGTSGTDFGINSSGSTHTFNLPTASATNRGALSSANWSTFNGKQDAITGAATTITSSDLTASRALVSDASGKVGVSTVTSSTLAFLDATSSVQTQLNGKEATITAGTTSQYYRGDKTFQTLDKNAVGLGNVDNTSDATKNSATATLTNKRINARTGTVASSATPTINTDNVDYYSITALATAITSFTTNLSGTPTIGQTLWISITDNGTARAITWGASFESSGNVTLPTTTVISTRLDVAFIWNEATSKWRCVGVA